MRREAAAWALGWGEMEMGVRDVKARTGGVMGGWVLWVAVAALGCQTGEPRTAGGPETAQPVVTAEAPPAPASAPAKGSSGAAPAESERSPLTALDNFYPIVEGRAYRGAQVRSETLEYFVRRYGIKTVINLRGSNPHADWYQREKADCDRLGLKMIDVRLSASDLPTPESLGALLNAFERENEPLLMHCRGGADRSGMAAALWRRVMLEEDAETAGRQLSFLYGHLRKVHPEMFDMVKMFVPSREWVEREFPALREAYESRRKPGSRRGSDD